MIKKTYHLQLDLTGTQFQDYNRSSLLFFDIETTGLTARMSYIYLIGAIAWEDNCWKCTQWFAQNTIEEPDILKEFLAYTQDKTLLIHFNGDRFDIPYINEKCETYHLDTTLSSIISRDLLRMIRPLRKMLQLTSLKQKSLESFLHVNRDDEYSGGELIDTYKEYIIKYKLKEDTFAELSRLLLHNREDVCALPEICGILSLCQLLSDDLSLLKVVSSSETPDVLNYKFKTDFPFPVKLVINNSSVQLNIYDNIAELSIKIIEGELKHFYKDYKNYYYIPEEGQAIHKSVAAYVDSSFKEKAKKENCFTRKKGYFLPAVCKLEIPSFKSEFNSTDEYFLFNDAFLNDESVIRQYCSGIIKSL